MFVTNAPLSGRPRQKTTWHFSGFPSGTAIYGHYRSHGRTIKNYRFGKPTGPCGTLTVRARRDADAVEQPARGHVDAAARPAPALPPQRRAARHPLPLFRTLL